MKKNNKIKKSVSVLAFLFVCAVSVILSSCSDELDIQQSYPFKVETMPVPKDIVRGQTVEIRCELKAEGKFDGTIYTIRYFQHDGKGSLRMENGTVFQPNDRYLLENEKFRLYYTSAGCSYASKPVNFSRSEVYREYFKEKTVIFSEKLPVGTYQFTVPLLPRFTGKYTLNPVKVELMYFPVVNANNAGREIWITERNTKDIRKKGND